MGIFDGGLLGGGGVAGVAEELGKPQDSAQADSYRKPMGVEDFDSFGTTLTQGKAVELAYWEAPAGIARRFGYGTAMAEANQGYAYGVFQNANGETIHGTVIFKWENSTGRGTQVVDEVDSKDINTTDRYNRDEQVPIPEDTSKKRAEQDERLVVEFEASTDPADITNSYLIDAANSEVRLPTTEYDLSTRVR
jgi:hypothetical protein